MLLIKIYAVGIIISFIGLYVWSIRWIAFNDERPYPAAEWLSSPMGIGAVGVVSMCAASVWPILAFIYIVGSVSTYGIKAYKDKKVKQEATR